MPVAEPPTQSVMRLHGSAVLQCFRLETACTESHLLRQPRFGSHRYAVSLWFAPLRCLLLRLANQLGEPSASGKLATGGL